MIVDPHGNAIGSGTPCATCKGVPERWIKCLICAYARYHDAVIYKGESDAEALAFFVHWRQLVGLTAEQAPLPTEATPAPHATRRASTPAGTAHGSETRQQWGKCPGCGWPHPLILGVIEPHRVNGVSCIGVGKSPASE